MNSDQSSTPNPWCRRIGVVLVAALLSLSITGFGHVGPAAAASAPDVTVSDGGAVTPAAPAVTHRLSVGRSGASGGTVIADSVGINCGTVCRAAVATGTSVTLTVTVDSRTRFTGWSGSCRGSSPSCTVTMSQARWVTANFARIPSYTLGVVRAGSGSGVVSGSTAAQPDVSVVNCGSVCRVSLLRGTVVTLTANPAAGSTFTGWSGSCRGSSPSCTVTMSQARWVTANFARIPSYTLGVVRAGSGSGVVSGSTAVQPDVSVVNCGSVCRVSLLRGTVVTLTATASPGSIFGGWSGSCTGTSPTCTVTMSQARNVTARFDDDPQPWQAIPDVDRISAVEVRGATSSYCRYTWTVEMPDGSLASTTFESPRHDNSVEIIGNVRYESFGSTPFTRGSYVILRWWGPVQPFLIDGPVILCTYDVSANLIRD
jgi:hypothetical protein